MIMHQNESSIYMHQIYAVFFIPSRHEILPQSNEPIATLINLLSLTMFYADCQALNASGFCMAFITCSRFMK